MWRAFLKIILIAFWIVIIGGWFELIVFTSEPKMVYYRLKPDDKQIHQMESTLGVDFPDKLEISEVRSTPIFFDYDDKISVTIYSNLNMEEWNTVFDGRVGNSISGKNGENPWTILVNYEAKDKLVITGSAKSINRAVTNPALVHGERVETRWICLKAGLILVFFGGLLFILFAYAIL